VPRKKISAQQREVEARHAKIKALLIQGKSVAEVCKEVGITPKRVYVVAERWNLPTNPKIWPGSEDESSIARLFACGWTPERIGKIFHHSPSSVASIMERVRQDPILSASAKRFGVETRGNRPRR
jgi:hypothetical protein